MTRLDGSDHDDASGVTPFAVGAGLRLMTLTDYMIVRLDLGFFLGTTAAPAFEGGVSAEPMIGGQIRIVEGFGVFAGLGAPMYAYGNNAIYESLVYGRGEIGIYSASESHWIDLSGHAGRVWGRFNTGDDTRRKLDGMIGTGGRLDVHFAWIHTNLDFTHMLSTWQKGSHGNVNIASGSLCVIPTPFALCVDGRNTRGEATVNTDLDGVSTVRTVSSFYGGVSIGIGFGQIGRWE